MGQPVPLFWARLGITAEGWDELHGESRAVIRRACLEKKAYTLGGAGSAATAVQASRYRCPFVLAGAEHWHVGHAPSMRTLQGIARTIRDLHHDRPTKPGTHASGKVR